MLCFFIPDSNYTHAPGVAGDFTLYTLPRGRPCIYVFSLGDETKRGAKLGVASYQCSVSIVAFVSPIG